RLCGQAPLRPGDRALLRAYQRRFLAHWGEQHRRYRPAPAQSGRPGSQQTLRTGETNLVEDSTNGGNNVWIRWSSAFSTYGRGPGVPGQVRSTLADPIATFPGPGKR